MPYLVGNWPFSKVLESEAADMGVPVMHPDLEPVFSHFKDRRELVLELWRIDLSGDHIAEIVGYPTPNAITRIISNARATKDPRAVRRDGYGGRGGRKSGAVSSAMGMAT